MKNWHEGLNEGDRVQSNFRKGTGKEATIVGFAGDKGPAHTAETVYLKADDGYMFHYSIDDLVFFLEQGSIKLIRKAEQEVA